MVCVLKKKKEIMKYNNKIVLVWLLFLVIFTKAKSSDVKSDKTIETGIILLIGKVAVVFFVK